MNNRSWEDIADVIFQDKRVNVRPLILAITNRAGLDVIEFGRFCKRYGVTIEEALNSGFRYHDHLSDNMWNYFCNLRLDYIDAVNYLKKAKLCNIVLGCNLSEREIAAIANKGKVYSPPVQPPEDYFTIRRKRKKNERV